MTRRTHCCGWALLALLAASCDGTAWNDRDPVPANGGDPASGARVISEFGCGACHSIPGIRGAGGRVAPSLSHFASRSFIAGQLPNTSANLERWILDPSAVEPGTAMPALGLSPTQARDVASFLQTLR